MITVSIKEITQSGQEGTELKRWIVKLENGLSTVMIPRVGDTIALHYHRTLKVIDVVWEFLTACDDIPTYVTIKVKPLDNNEYQNT